MTRTPATASATLDVRGLPGEADAVRAQLTEVVGDDIAALERGTSPPSSHRVAHTLSAAVTSVAH